MAIAVGALGVGLSILAKIHFQIHLTVAKVIDSQPATGQGNDIFI